MDNDRFDDFTRALTEGRSRRGATRLLGGFALAGPLALRNLGDAEAKKGKNKKKKCKKGETRCGKNCADLNTDQKNCGKCGQRCEADQQCLQGECYTTCVPACGTAGGDAEVCCFGSCANLTTDAQNCGQCGTACAENEVCRFANCVCDGPRCPVPGGGTRCCPAVNGVCCASGKCCPAGETCAEEDVCCASGYYSCGNGFCCPIGLNCAGFECVE